MPSRRHARVVFLPALLTAVLAAGCSGDDERSGDERASTAGETGPAEKREPRRRSRKQREDMGGGSTNKAPLSKAELERQRKIRKREAAQDRRSDREFDRAFTETPFERIVGQLPVRKPPLFVEQYITSEGSSTLYTAVAPKRFFCGRSAARRKAAVSAFYRDADRLFRRKGVKDFVQVVTAVAETTERLRALAVGRQGSVSLTKRGRAKGPC